MGRKTYQIGKFCTTRYAQCGTKLVFRLGELAANEVLDALGAAHVWEVHRLGVAEDTDVEAAAVALGAANLDEWDRFDGTALHDHDAFVGDHETATAQANDGLEETPQGKHSPDQDDEIAEIGSYAGAVHPADEHPGQRGEDDQL